MRMKCTEGEKRPWPNQGSIYQRQGVLIHGGNGGIGSHALLCAGRGPATTSAFWGTTKEERRPPRENTKRGHGRIGHMARIVDSFFVGDGRKSRSQCRLRR